MDSKLMLPLGSPDANGKHSTLLIFFQFLHFSTNPFQTLLSPLVLRPRRAAGFLLGPIQPVGVVDCVHFFPLSCEPRSHSHAGIIFSRLAVRNFLGTIYLINPGSAFSMSAIAWFRQEPPDVIVVTARTFLGRLMLLMATTVFVCPASTILSPRVASFRNVTELTEQTLRKIIVRQRW